LVKLELPMEPNELRSEPIGFSREAVAVPDRDQFHPMLSGKPRQLSNRLVPTDAVVHAGLNCRSRRNLPGPADHGDF